MLVCMGDRARIKRSGKDSNVDWSYKRKEVVENHDQVTYLMSVCMVSRSRAK